MTLKPDDWLKVVDVEKTVYESGVPFAEWCVGISTDPAVAVYEYHHSYEKVLCVDFESPFVALEVHRLFLHKGSLGAKCANGRWPRFFYAFPAKCAAMI